MATERDEIIAQVRDEMMKELGGQGGNVDFSGVTKTFDRLAAGSRSAWEIETVIKYKTKASE